VGKELRGNTRWSIKHAFPLTSDALDQIGHDLDRRARAGGKLCSYEDYKRARAELEAKNRRG
jgi:hypothetical protein